jgi:cation transport ATPase
MAVLDDSGVCGPEGQDGGSAFRPGVESLAERLTALGLEMAFLSPGDHGEAEAPASHLGIRESHAGVPNEERARVFTEILKETHGRALLLSTELDEDVEGGVAVIPDAWNSADGPCLARSRVLLAGPSPEPLGALIAQARRFRRLALASLGAAALAAAGGAALAFMTPSWLWLIGAWQSALSAVLIVLAANCGKRAKRVPKEAELSSPPETENADGA